MNKCLLYSLLLAFFGLCGCQNWLDVKPKTSINEEDLYTTESGFKDVITGFYIKMGLSSFYGSTLTFTFMDRLGQRYDVDVAKDQDKVYDFEDTQRSQTDQIYSNMYNLIANINNFLAFLETNRSVIETEKYYDLMKGEALGLRGFLYFDLLRMFGPIYSEKPDGLAIPYRTTFDKIATPRLSARQVVDLVLKDLLEAQTLLKDTDPLIFDEGKKSDDPFFVMRQLRMNIYAVKATLARVYLYKGSAEDKQEALQYAREVIESEHFQFHQSAIENHILFKEHIFSLYVYELEKVTDPLFNSSSASNMWYSKGSSIDEVYETEGAGSGDTRVSAFKSIVDDRRVTTKYEQTGYINDYSGKGLVPLIRLPEMYYIMAECETDPDESITWLNLVRTQRAIAIPLELTSDYDRPYRDGYDPEKTFRTNEIMKEYMKEFYGEGQLFYFYKRLFYKNFFHCPLEKGMTAESYIFHIPDSEILFGNNKE